jgi:hypothetical protein
MPIYTPAFNRCFITSWWGWLGVGFFEIEMDNNRQIVCTFWSVSNLLLIAYSGG